MKVSFLFWDCLKEALRGVPDRFGSVSGLSTLTRNLPCKQKYCACCAQRRGRGGDIESFVELVTLMKRAGWNAKQSAAILDICGRRSTTPTPLIDCRPVRDIVALANLPRVTLDGRIDPEPWTSSSRVSLSANIDAAERLGARIVNDPRAGHAT